MPPTSPFQVVLKTDRVKLIPFEPAKHAHNFIGTPDRLYDYLPLGPWRDVEHFKNQFWIPRVEKACGESALWAIFDTTRPEKESFAGCIGYLNTSFVDLCTEIGFVIILPAFQKTHVTTNAVGLLMQYALNLPNTSGQQGLGFRRLVWQASSGNYPSIVTAKRMGFQVEGIMRWRRVLDDVNSKAWNGKAIRKGDLMSPCLGRDSVMFSVCWDDWEQGTKSDVEAKMNRLQ